LLAIFLVTQSLHKKIRFHIKIFILPKKINQKLATAYKPLSMHLSRITRKQLKNMDNSA